MGKEAYDDYQRHQRDTEANSQRYLVLEPSSDLDAEDIGPRTRAVPSSKLRVGDLVVLEKNQRVPADMVLLRTSDNTGTCFIRTDQLDGETDWKLRVAVASCQELSSDRDLLDLDAEIYGKLFVSSSGFDVLIALCRYSGRTDERHQLFHRNILNSGECDWERCTGSRGRTSQCRECSVVKHSTCCRHGRWLRHLYRFRNSSSYEYEPP